MSVASGAITGVERGRNSGRAVESLLRLASAAQFVRSADGRLHARVPIDDRREIYGLKSASFRDWLIERYRSEGGSAAASGRGEARFDVARSSRGLIAARRRFTCGWGGIANAGAETFILIWATRRGRR